MKKTPRHRESGPPCVLLPDKCQKWACLVQLAVGGGGSVSWGVEDYSPLPPNPMLGEESDAAGGVSSTVMGFCLHQSSQPLCKIEINNAILQMRAQAQRG